MWYNTADMTTRRRERFKNRRGFSTRSRKARCIVWVAAIAVAIMVLSGIAYYQLLSHLQSTSFCEKLSKLTQNLLHAEQITLREQFQINGRRIALGEAVAHGLGKLDYAAARGISTEIDRGELWNRCLALHKLAIEEIEVRFNIQPTPPPASLPAPNRPTQATSTAVPPSTYTPETPKDTEQGGILRNLMPNRFKVSLLECKDTDIHLQWGNQQYALLGHSSTAKPQSKLGRHTWQISLENGRLHTPLTALRDSSVKNATILISPQEINLTESRLMLSPGELRVRGSYNIHTNHWTSVLRINKANVARLLNDDWAKRLHGELYGEVELSGTKSQLDRGSGYISLQKGELEALPILSELLVGNTRPYRSLPLEKAECRLRYPYNDARHNIEHAWLFDQIDIRSAQGLLLVRGHIIVGTDKSLSGTLSLGLPEHKLNEWQLAHQAIPAGIISKKDDQGYLWVNINLSGTLDAPQEDLTIRLSTLLGQALPQLLGNSTQAVGNLINRILMPSPPPATDTPPQNKEDTSPDNPPAIQKAGQLFNRTIRSLF